MSLSSAKKFFEENLRHVSANKDPVIFNINTGLLRLVVELDKELKIARQERVHLSAQIDDLKKRLAR